MKISIHWFRRDLRLQDNHSLFEALRSSHQIIPIFIFDKNILEALPSKSDARVEFIFNTLMEINEELKEYKSAVQIFFGTPEEVYKDLIKQYEIDTVFYNEDYEPYAIKRDDQIRDLLTKNKIKFKSFKDQVIFNPLDVLKADSTPYLVFTPYSKAWKKELKNQPVRTFASERHLDRLKPLKETNITSLDKIGFKETNHDFPKKVLLKTTLQKYQKDRDFPFIEKGTTHAGVHLRFGTLSVRKAVRVALEYSETWLNELIWREFFMTVLFHFPKTVNEPFNEKYKNLKWRKSPEELQKWKEGKTGYPIIDAGMRELKATGFMHNRVRMAVGSFLTKHLFLHWKEGETHFANLLLDYDLSANVGNWQWVAGCGVDAAPYFRIFNPYTQQKKFDPDLKYVKKWIPEFGTKDYPEPIVQHEVARVRALDSFKKALKG